MHLKIWHKNHSSTRLFKKPITVQWDPRRDLSGQLQSSLCSKRPSFLLLLHHLPKNSCRCRSPQRKVSTRWSMTWRKRWAWCRLTLSIASTSLSARYNAIGSPRVSSLSSKRITVPSGTLSNWLSRWKCSSSQNLLFRLRPGRLHNKIRATIRNWQTMCKRVSQIIGRTCSWRRVSTWNEALLRRILARKRLLRKLQLRPTDFPCRISGGTTRSSSM